MFVTCVTLFLIVNSNYVTVGLALRFVLDALRKPNTSKMYYFGIAALDRFKSRLKDYHKYCEHVAAIQHFGDFPQHLIEVCMSVTILL
jgi:CCR4-NOT transcription complex subunit 1